MAPTLDSSTNPSKQIPSLRSSTQFLTGGVLLVLAFVVIYVLTLDTGFQPIELQGGDLITHQYAQVQARPSNAPGYPIYTMGGWLWFHAWHGLVTLAGRPLANPILILSSYSTIWALLALWLLYKTLGELLGIYHNAWQATLFCLLVTAFFGVTYFFWYYATTTEQYSSAVAQTLAIFYLYLQWDKAPARRNLLYLIAFLCGISLAHMLTVAFIVPPLVVLILWRDPTLLRSPRAIVYAILCAAAPLLSYIYVYMRGALHPEWWGRGYWASPQLWFWSFVSTAQGRDELARAFEPGRSFFGNGFPSTIWQELSVPLLLLGLIGIFFLPRRPAILLYTTLFIYTVFCWFYRFGNWFQVILPAYPLVLLGLAPYYERLSRNRSTVARLGQYAVLATLVVALLWRVNQSLPAANSRHRLQDSALSHAAMLLNQPLPGNARLFAAVDDSLAINYLTEIWGIRHDIKTLNSHDANADLSGGGKVIATADSVRALMAELTMTATMDGLSPDWLVLTTQPSSAAEPALVEAPIFTVTPDLILAGYAVQPAPSSAPLYSPDAPALDVLLTWQLPTGKWPQNLSVSLRPTFQGVQQVDPVTGDPLQQDRQRPLDGLWMDEPIERMAAKPVVIHDPYRLPQPTLLAHPADGLLLILYTQSKNGFTNIAEIPLPLPSAGS